MIRWSPSCGQFNRRVATDCEGSVPGPAALSDKVWKSDLVQVQTAKRAEIASNALVQESKRNVSPKERGSWREIWDPAPVPKQEAAPPMPPPDDDEALPDKELILDGMVPPPLVKLHKRLAKRSELLKLHVKHYHMSSANK